MNIVTAIKGYFSRSPSLAQLFNGYAEQYRNAFPEQLKSLLVVSTTQPVYASPDLAEFLTSHAAEVREMIKEAAQRMRAEHTAGTAGKEVSDSGTINCISVNIADTSTKRYVSDKFSQVMNASALFDHEMGHLVVKEGWPDDSRPHIAECAADAYAVLRHLQRFGGATDIFEQAPYTVAVQAIFEPPPIHYTSAAIQQVARLHQGGILDIFSLSLQETARVAGDIALQYSLDDNTLDKIHAAFSPVRERYKESRRDEQKILKAIIQVMRDNKNDHDIYRAGKLYLHSAGAKEHLDHMISHDLSLLRDFVSMSAHERDSGFILNAAAAIDAKRAAAETRPASQPLISGRP
ncbi:MAG: hypothetical protein HY052_00450 [Proteobacteria bacterium]|nr:hypothetical protein [Pseudomonadota bacterium]